MGVALRSWAAVAAALIFVSCNGSPSPPPQPSPTSPAASAPAPPSPSPQPLLQGEPRLAEIGKFDSPIFLTAPKGDPRLFVVEKTGAIEVVSDGRVLEQPFIDLQGEVSNGSEQGLLSMAFSPDYSRDGLAYVNFTDIKGDTRVIEFKVSRDDPNKLDPSTRREILVVGQPFSNHNGGLVLFDPKGMLIVGMGDGGSANDPANRAQDRGDLLGKLLRIDPRRPAGDKPYSIPADNPNLSGPGRQEIWTYGMRNPWRFSFDPEGNLWLGDVGQNRFEEIDFVPSSSFGVLNNFGWRAYEGTSRAKSERIDETHLITPFHTYPTAGGRCAVTGGHVYRGRVAALQGFYLFGDYCDGQVRGIRVSDRGAAPTIFQTLKTTSLPSFGEDASGELYVISIEGPVFKVTAG